MELECGYSPQDKTIAILSFWLAVPASAKAALENLPWEEHCSETLLLPPPFYRHSPPLPPIPRLHRFEPPA